MKTLLRSCFLVAALLVVFHDQLAIGYDNCNTYPTSRVVSSYQYGTYCGATGSGCQYCWNNDLGDYCYGNLPSGCGIDYQIY